jgi:hypothetical protein
MTGSLYAACYDSANNRPCNHIDATQRRPCRRNVVQREPS